MSILSRQKKVRKWHRRLGLVLGIQFFLWTVGGIYFSWTSIDHIRGDDLRKSLPVIIPDSGVCSPDRLMDAILKSVPDAQPEKFQLIDINGTLTYQVVLKKPQGHALLVDAHSARLRPPLAENEARQLAIQSLKVGSPVLHLRYLKEAGPHHEYREKPLPAYAVTFGAPANTTVYVSAEQGTVQSMRNSSWRIFDFLWMMHTMDYAGRDDINNWVLRIFSLVGLAAICSGVILFIVTSPVFRKKRSGNNKL